MLRTNLIAHLAPDSRSAADPLGPEHPLARASDAFDGAVRQCLALVLPACCGAVAAALGASWARPVLGATAFTATILAARIRFLLLRGEDRDRRR